MTSANSVLVFLVLTSLGCTTMKKEVTVRGESLSIEITSTIYELGDETPNKPIIYITDGEEAIAAGVDLLLDSLTESNIIPPAYYVYVSSTNNLTLENERNNLFFCNQEFLSFFEHKLIPGIETQIGKTFTPENRALVGVSFGGLNGAFFASKSSLIKNYGLLSPITYPCEDIHASIAFSDSKDLNIWVSTGTNDAENYSGPLVELFKSKGYKVKYAKTPGSHDFENWKGQLSHVINFLFN